MSLHKLRSALELPLPSTLPAGEAVSSRRVEDEVLWLFDACEAGLRRYVASFGLGPEITEDLLQDVFPALFRHLSRVAKRKRAAARADFVFGPPVTIPRARRSTWPSGSAAPAASAPQLGLRVTECATRPAGSHWPADRPGPGRCH
jgi:hypothetical protein